MVEFLKRNVRAIVIALLALGIVVVIANAGNDNDRADNSEQSTVAQEEQSTQESTGEEQAAEEPTPQTEIDEALPQPSTDSSVDAQEGSYSVAAVSGDNQSIMARKIVAEFLSDNEKTLKPGQLLYIETNIVKDAGAKERIAVGDVVSVSTERLNELLTNAEALSNDRIAAWERYL